MSYEFKSNFARNLCTDGKQGQLVIGDNEHQQLDADIAQIKQECNQLFFENNDWNPNCLVLKQSGMNNVQDLITNHEINSLKIQLKQAETSRQMYRTILEQVLSYLEQVHINLESLSDKLEGRDKSAHLYDMNRFTISMPRSSDYNTFRDFTLRKPNKPLKFSPDEIPPDKLSKEASSLIRVIRLTLNTTQNAKNVDHYYIKKEFLKAIKQEFCQKKCISNSSNNNDNIVTVTNTDEERGKSKSDRHSSSFDNESGFSSMNSFQEKPLLRLRDNFLPKIVSVNENGNAIEKKAGHCEDFSNQKTDTDPLRNSAAPDIVRGGGAQ